MQPHSWHANFELWFIIPTSIKTCIALPHLTPILHWKALGDEWQWRHPGMDQQTGRANQLKECCWCWCWCFYYDTRRIFFLPLRLTGCLSELCWTELYNWVWKHSSTSCLPSCTNQRTACRQNNSGARHRTRFLYIPDISTCKLRLACFWLVRCDVIFISERHKTGVSQNDSL